MKFTHIQLMTQNPIKNPITHLMTSAEKGWFLNQLSF